MAQGIRLALGTLVAAGFAAQANPQSVNESNLWYGGDEGIEVVFETGINLADTEESPKVDPRMTRHARAMDQALLKIGERSYLAYGWALTSPMMVLGDDGIIIVDPPESVEAGEETMEAFRRVTDLPVKAIVYTHNHFDHVAAVKAFTTEEEVASGKVEIFAHETLLQGVINWASTVGPIESRRTSYTGAVFLPKGPDGSVHDALGPDARVGTVTFIPPNRTFIDELDVTIAGVRMHLKHVPSETDDEIVAWFPDLELLHSAEVMQGENFPNLYTIRGTKYRDPVKWFKGIDVLRGFPAKYLVPSHGRPIVGEDNVQEMLTAYRDAIQFVHDQTIRYMNRGFTPEQLVEVVELPPHLAEHPWLNEYYGTVTHAVRNIYNGYLGWFQADPWALDPLPYAATAAPVTNAQTEHFHPKGKPPSEHTKKILEQAQAALPFADKRDFEELTVDGVKMVFQNTPNTEAPSEMNTWFPEMKALWMAENVNGAFHNIYTLRAAHRYGTRLPGRSTSTRHSISTASRPR